MFAAGIEFARADQPRTRVHARLTGAIARARAVAEPETIVIGLSGHGVLDLPAYHD